MPEWLVQEGTIEVNGLPDFSPILGCTVGGDEYSHIGMLFTRVTACGKPLKDTFLSRNVTVNCPECVAEIKYRAEHPEVASREMGVVTHKEVDNAGSGSED